MTSTNLVGMLFRQCVLVAFILEAMTHTLCVNMWPTGGERPGQSWICPVLSWLLWSLIKCHDSKKKKRKKDKNHPKLQIYSQAGIVALNLTKSECSLLYGGRCLEDVGYSSTFTTVLPIPTAVPYHLSPIMLFLFLILTEDMLIDFRGGGTGGRETGRETSMWERNVDWLPIVLALIGDQTCNPVICPDQESISWPFGDRTTLEPTEPC